MKPSSPRHERFREILQPLIFRSGEMEGAEETSRLAEIRAGLPPMLADSGIAEQGKVLEQRAVQLGKKVGNYLSQRLRKFSQDNLKATHSYSILFAYARLVDAVHGFVFETAWEEISILAALALDAGEKEDRFRSSLIPNKKATLGGINSEQNSVEDPQEGAYYQKMAADLEKEIVALEAASAVWQGERPGIEAFQPDRESFLAGFVIFARGGYGRGELSFSSDLDTGYCIDPLQLNPGEVRVCQELIVRMESLLRRAGLEPSHQYFEIGEDLSRFREPETIHTIPSVLESRPLLGNAGLLERLQAQFLDVLPYEKFLNKKIEEYEGQSEPSLTEMDVKEDQGGLRTIQTPLWILGVTHRVKSFATTDLIGLAVEKKVLSTGDAARFLMGLEFLHELRNFTGLAEKYYYDHEARAALGVISEFARNRIDDRLARLYLFRKRRFPSLDAFDSFRLRLVDGIHRVSQKLLNRILDQTISREHGLVKLSIHLGKRCIISMEPLSGGKGGSIAELFGGPRDLLRLMAYVAESGYDLAEDLKDSLAEVVGCISPAEDEKGREEQVAVFNAIMGAPHTHRALETMWDINDPLSDGWKSLLGRFIPECDGFYYLLREASTLKIPVHQHLILAVQHGQRCLEWLRADYYEFHAQLTPHHVLALKWSLLLHAAGKTLSSAGESEKSGDIAAQAMARIGYQEPYLEGLVRLLIENHDTVSNLTRTATYQDQALVALFEAAERETMNVVLFFLINLAILQADGQRSEGVLLDVTRFFDETTRILLELPGVPDAPLSLEMINFYLDKKKAQLETETRLYLLLNRGLAVGLGKALFEPLAKNFPKEWKKVEPQAEELDGLLRRYLLSMPGEKEHGQSKTRILRMLATDIGETALRELTQEQSEIFSWFFSAFPNRFLLGSAPSALAEQMLNFRDFQQLKARAVVIPGLHGIPERLLFFTSGLPNSHSRVAYALSRRGINIVSGKVNPVVLDDGKQGYCYYFQISILTQEKVMFPRELENLILHETPRPLKPIGQEQEQALAGTRLEFLGNDKKGYAIARNGSEFTRRDQEFKHIRVTLRDQPFLFYKVTKVFDEFDVEIQQALITTTGRHVMDYFYLLPDDYDRLRGSNFVERFNRTIKMGLE